MKPTKKVLDDLKLRFGWGKTGNQLIPNVYNAYTLYAPDPQNNAYDINGTGTSIVGGFDLVQFGNANGKWETNTSTNIGLDAVLLNNKLELVLDVYNRKTTDMLTQIAIPRTAGTGTIPYTNIGEVTNKGFDIGLNFRDRKGDFYYTVGVNFGHYKNEVVKLNNDPNSTIFGFATRLPAMSPPKQVPRSRSYYGYFVDGVIKDKAEADAAPKFGSYTREGYIQIQGRQWRRYHYRCRQNDHRKPSPGFQLWCERECWLQSIRSDLIRTGRTRQRDLQLCEDTGRISTYSRVTGLRICFITPGKNQVMMRNCQDLTQVMLPASRFRLTSWKTVLISGSKTFS
jgi:hypothetical protein